MGLASHTYTLMTLLAACLLVPAAIVLCIGKHVSCTVPNGRNRVTGQFEKIWKQGVVAWGGKSIPELA
jgi:hypothetical protein